MDIKVLLQLRFEKKIIYSKHILVSYLCILYLCQESFHVIKIKSLNRPYSQKRRENRGSEKKNEKKK